MIALLINKNNKLHGVYEVEGHITEVEIPSDLHPLKYGMINKENTAQLLLPILKFVKGMKIEEVKSEEVFIFNELWQIRQK